MDSMEMESVQEPSSKCLLFLRILWKFCKCIFSHVTLVSLVGAYCVLGAYAFHRLESEHERDVKRSIKYVRHNITNQLWSMTENAEVLKRENWTKDAVNKLREFETVLLMKMKKEGWDGSEGDDNIQWTFAGALFYSIIVITTIGYGHIAPKTKNGKVVTIFYAILGIPLMLLCLSNIGDVMASSFRFLYWRVCCFICTRPPKPRRTRSSNAVRGYSTRQSSGRSISNRAPSFRRSIRLNERSVDSTMGLRESINRSTHTDIGCDNQTPRRFDINACSDETEGRLTSPSTASPRNLQLPSTLRHTFDTPSTLTSPRITGKVRNATSPMAGMTQSLDRRFYVHRDNIDRTPVLCNKYALDEPDIPEMSGQSRENRGLSLPRTNTNSDGRDGFEYSVLQRTSPSMIPRRCRSMDRGSTIDRTRQQKREAPSPRIMSPMGFVVHRQVYANEIDYDDYSIPIEDDTIKPVPIWLCVFLVVSYILGGAVLFTEWEKWSFLDSAYFCFITLTTIGFGDFVPAHKLNAHQGILLCSLYLLFGIALLAMSFNLVQEEVITNVKSVAKRLGIIKEDISDCEDSDYDEREIEEYDIENYNSDCVEYPGEQQRNFYSSGGDIQVT